MKSIAKLPNEDRKDLFRNTATKMGLHDAIIEKDFWVCFILDYLFHQSPWRNDLVFKGGTSLSKCFDLIKRFSEDIDLILDWRTLGYGLREPMEERSKTKQEVFNKDMNDRTEEFLKDVFIPSVKNDLSEELGFEVALFADPSYPQTVVFNYPRLNSNSSLIPGIRLEIGALAAWSPQIMSSIKPYCAVYYPQVFEMQETTVLTAAPERTFWEKATILHHEANRPKNSPMPQRYSRHYYDLYCMITSKVKESALNEINLLQKVVEFKEKFYPRGWAKYSEAVPKTLKLVPPSYRLEELQSDYLEMQDMLYGNGPDFNVIMETIKLLEEEIHDF